MTSPYLERPVRPLEEAKRQVGPRNWGVPPQKPFTAEELTKIAERFDTYGEKETSDDGLPLFDRFFILTIAAALGLSAGLLFFLAIAR